jgi:hypothetical protein
MAMFNPVRLTRKSFEDTTKTREPEKEREREREREIAAELRTLNQ